MHKTPVRRGRTISRAAHRALREIQTIISQVTFRLVSPRPGHIAIVTLDPTEENATATAAVLGHDSRVKRIIFAASNKEIARASITLACGRLEREVPQNIEYSSTRYRDLLRAYARSTQTYSTHVMLPGNDSSGKRTHVHLTHGSGPKPDTTYRGPTNVLAAVVPVWTQSQMREYRLAPGTPTLPLMPRLEVMRRAVGDRSVNSRLGLPNDRSLLVWAPTYRSIRRRGEVRVSGEPIRHWATDGELSLHRIRQIAERHGYLFVAKVHPFDADDLQGLGFHTFTSQGLIERGVTSYELFGAADFLITDYSSIFTERAALALPFALHCPDLEEFERSYRGFREPHFRHLLRQFILKTGADLDMALDGDLPAEEALINLGFSKRIKPEDYIHDMYGLVERCCSR